MYQLIIATAEFWLPAQGPRAADDSHTRDGPLLPLLACIFLID